MDSRLFLIMRLLRLVTNNPKAHCGSIKMSYNVRDVVGNISYLQHILCDTALYYLHELESSYPALSASSLVAK